MACSIREHFIWNFLWSISAQNMSGCDTGPHTPPAVQGHDASRMQRDDIIWSHCCNHVWVLPPSGCFEDVSILRAGHGCVDRSHLRGSVFCVWLRQRHLCLDSSSAGLYVDYHQWIMCARGRDLKVEIRSDDGHSFHVSASHPCSLTNTHTHTLPPTQARTNALTRSHARVRVHPHPTPYDHITPHRIYAHWLCGCVYRIGAPLVWTTSKTSEAVCPCLCLE